jgi:hypothetical protein
MLLIWHGAGHPYHQTLYQPNTLKKSVCVRTLKGSIVVWTPVVWRETVKREPGFAGLVSVNSGLRRRWRPSPAPLAPYGLRSHRFSPLPEERGQLVQSGRSWTSQRAAWPIRLERRGRIKWTATGSQAGYTDHASKRLLSFRGDSFDVGSLFFLPFAEKECSIMASDLSRSVDNGNWRPFGLAVEFSRRICHWFSFSFLQGNVEWGLRLWSALPGCLHRSNSCSLRPKINAILGQTRKPMWCKMTKIPLIFYGKHLAIDLSFMWEASRVSFFCG